MKQSGASVTNRYLLLCILIRSVVPRQSATTDSNWLANPNSGQSELMPPRGSITPSYKNQPHAATNNTLEKKFALQERVLPSGCHTLPRKSCSKNRPTRVPASIV